MSQRTNLSHMLLGALVADAAALGVHWLYEPERIDKIAERQNGRSAFTPVDPENYADTKAYFAHSERRSGMLTQYGECLYLAIRTINETGGEFDPEAYQSAFLAHFGAGGRYVGYIDRPTRGALENLTAEKKPSGIDDDQLPAITRLPAIIAAHHEDPDLAKHARIAMEITNVNEIAADYTSVFLDLFRHLMAGTPLNQAITQATSDAPKTLRHLLQDALETTEQNSTIYAEKTGRACHLPMAGPLIFHILARSQTYTEAVERNNLAGGDNAGRSLLIGAVMGLLHGLDGPNGIPLDWILRLSDNSEIWKNCRDLANAKP